MFKYLKQNEEKLLCTNQSYSLDTLFEYKLILAFRSSCDILVYQNFCNFVSMSRFGSKRIGVSIYYLQWTFTSEAARMTV